MNRLDFSKSIDIDPALQVKYYFKETMAMYNLFEGINYKYIRGFTNDDNSIRFSVKFNNESDTNIVAENLLHKTVSIYSQHFIINGEIVSKTELSLNFAKILV